MNVKFCTLRSEYSEMSRERGQTYGALDYLEGLIDGMIILGQGAENKNELPDEAQASFMVAHLLVAFGANLVQCMISQDILLLTTTIK